MTGRAATGAPLGDDTDLTAGGAAAGEGTPTVSLAALAAGPAEAIEPDPVLLQAIEVWRVRLSSAGVACRAVAVQGADPQWRVSFPAALTAVQNQWSELCSRPDPLPPGAVVRIDLQAGSDLLVAAAISLPNAQPGMVGVAVAPPFNDRTVQLVALSLGWLQLALAASQVDRSRRAGRLLELLGHVASQTGARGGAQEWINRTAAWARNDLGSTAPAFALTLFELRGGLPRWWVSSDTAWAETASPALLEATEVAAQALVEMQDVQQPGWWAAPVLDGGKVVTVLVARLDAAPGLDLPEPVKSLLRASLGLAEPLLRHWRQADDSLLRHLLAATRSAWTKITGPGHLSWKAGAAGVVLALLVLLVWPVPDRVTANTVIEGQLRQVITAPFDGFIGQVAVRPGQRVVRGQVLARLDDRDLKLEQGKVRSERDQAHGKLRQSMSDHDAPAMALARAELQQAEAQLALVEAKLARSELLSPQDGLLVTGDWVQQIGGPVETGKEMFEIAAGKGYRVVLHVPDRDIARVKLGQIGALRLTGQPGTSHVFRVSNLTATAGVQDGSNGFRVEAEWQGEVPALSPGMQGIGKIEVGQSNLLTVWTRSSIDWLRLKLWSWWW